MISSLRSLLRPIVAKPSAWVAAVLAGSLVLLVLGTGSSPKPSSHALPAIRTDLVPKRIHGVPLAIPRNYFTYPPSGKEEEDAPIQAMWPEMVGATLGNRQEFWAIGGGHRRKLLILLYSIEVVDLRRWMAIGAPDAEPTSDRPLVHGLYHVESYATRRLTDVFYELTNGELSFVIECNGIGTVPYPGCSTLVRFEGIPVKISFDRTHLPEWRAIEQKVRALLQSFKREDKPPNSQP